MSASRAASFEGLRYVRQYVELLDAIGVDAFRAQMTSPVLVGIGLFGSTEGPKGRRTHEVDSSSAVAVLQSLLDRVWHVEKRPHHNNRWITLGQDHDNDIVIAEYSLSSRHCAFAWEGERFALADLDSLNGTYVQGNKMPVRQPMLIHDGQKLTLGRLQLVFCSADGFVRRIMAKSKKIATPCPLRPAPSDPRSLPAGRRGNRTRKVRR
ncbi:MAG TPA: FHA domain-containing protein [Polyangiaceae bacterium]|nr:FHA domain-containing protein [Polyangiaceae bacterium]